MSNVVDYIDYIRHMPDGTVELHGTQSGVIQVSEQMLESALEHAYKAGMVFQNIHQHLSAVGCVVNYNIATNSMRLASNVIVRDKNADKNALAKAYLFSTCNCGKCSGKCSGKCNE